MDLETILNRIDCIIAHNEEMVKSYSILKEKEKDKIMVSLMNLDITIKNNEIKFLKQLKS
jgi:argininosuccinate lyase